MGPPLLDDIWNRRGISLLWDADALARLCAPSQVVSLRRFLRLHATGWPESDLPLVHEVALVVAGLEGCINALTPEDACLWLEHIVYPAVVAFQREVADGGSQAALCFWIADPKRLDYRTSDDTHYWLCDGEHRGERVPLGRCLFNGAHHDLRRIHVGGDRSPETWVGLYHPRIS